MTDLLLNDDFDLDFKVADLKVGSSTNQNQELLILIGKGEIRQFPNRGVGIRSWLLDDQDGDINGAVKKEFERDGMMVKTIRTVSGNINIDAEYD